MLSLGLLALLAAPAAAATAGPEALRALSVAALAQAEGLKPRSFRPQRMVSVSGDARLSGQEFAPAGRSFLSVYLTGTGSVRGSDGTSSGSFSVNERVSVFLSDGRQHYSEHVRVNRTVSLYRGGRFVGTTQVSGSIWVTGWRTGDWLRLSGSGSVSGSLFVRDDEPPQAP